MASNPQHFFYSENNNNLNIDNSDLKQFLRELITVIKTLMPQLRQYSFSSELSQELMFKHSSNLTSNIVEVHKSIMENSKSYDEEQKKKEKVVKAMNDMITKQAFHCSAVELAMASIGRKKGRCGEFSYLAFAVLISHFRQLFSSIEIIELDSKSQAGDHQCLVLNRNKKSNLYDPLSWGPSCIIYDPFMGEVCECTNIPNDLSLSHIAQFGRESFYSIKSTLDESLSTQFYENSQEWEAFQKLITATQHAGQEYMLSQFSLLLEKAKISIVTLNKLMFKIKFDNIGKIQYKNNTYYLYCNSEESSQELAKEINKLAIGQAKSRRVKGTTEYLVQLKSFNPEKLQALFNSSSNCLATNNNNENEDFSMNPCFKA